MEPKLTLSQLLEYLRKSLKVKKNSALFMQVASKVLDGGVTIGDAYAQYGDSDGYLYVYLGTEDPF